MTYYLLLNMQNTHHIKYNTILFKMKENKTKKIQFNKKKLIGYTLIMLKIANTYKSVLDKFTIICVTNEETKYKNTNFVDLILFLF